MNIPKQVSFILNKLTSAGYEAYIVGGCVRDMLMGNTPADWDICTSALPQKVKSVFEGERIIETGLRYGTVTLLLNDIAYEITTFRIDGDYENNRRPKEVRFVSGLNEDLKRRDFTVNAMAYHPKTGLVDLFGGEKDIKEKKVRCVGSAQMRFEEDALRIMRALRFAAKLNFSIVPSTAAAIIEKTALLQSVAPQRVYKELAGLLCSDYAENILLEYREALAQVLPQLKPMFGFEQHTKYHAYDVWTHTVKAVAAAPNDIVLKLTMLFHDSGKPSTFTQDENLQGHFYGHPSVSVRLAKQMLDILCVDNRTKEEVLLLVEKHDVTIEQNKKAVKRVLVKLGEPMFRKLLTVKRCDTMGQAQWLRKNKLNKINKLELLLDELLNEDQCFTLAQLKINGNDIMSMGVPKGKQVGKILNTLFCLVLDEEIENDTQQLIQWARKLMEEKGF